MIGLMVLNALKRKRVAKLDATRFLTIHLLISAKYHPIPQVYKKILKLHMPD